MVRLKTRYLLFQLIYPTNGTHKVEEGSVGMMLDSSPQVSAGLLVAILRSSLQKNFGDYGASMVQTSFSVKYFSSQTGTGIIRCHREAVDHVRAAMFFVSSIDGKPCVFSCISVSGSIKKTEIIAMRRARRILSEAKAKGLIKKNVNSDSILSSMFKSNSNTAGDNEDEEDNEM